MRSAEMNPTIEKRLMRLLHGELPRNEARRLEQRLAEDGGMRAAYERLAKVWESVPEPPEGRLPAGFAAGVMAAAREIEGGGLSWSLAPAWARAGAALALAAGLALGAAFDRGFTGSPRAGGKRVVAVAGGGDIDDAEDADAVPLTLSEVYWLALEDSGGRLASSIGEDGGERVQ